MEVFLSIASLFLGSVAFADIDHLKAKKWYSFTNIALLVFFCFYSAGLNAKQSGSKINEYIIFKFKPQYLPVCETKNGIVLFSLAQVDTINLKYHCVSAKRINNGKKRKIDSYTFVLSFDQETDVNEAIKAYAATGYFDYVEPDFLGVVHGSGSFVPNDQYFDYQWNLNNDGAFPGSKIGADIRMCSAWNIEQGDSSIIVAVIDGGAKLDHPEFAGRIWRNYNYIGDSSGAYPNDSVGWNFAYDNNNPTDDYGHGTNVAGIIGATGNNTIGFAGIDWHCKLMILKVLDSNDYATHNGIITAINYAVDNGAKVINLSLGGPRSSSALQDAINYAYVNNVTVAASMGNSGDSTIDYPAGCQHVIAVGATDDRDYRVDFSCYGPDISVVAPGKLIFGLDFLSNTNYGLDLSGTSQATPHVSGLASLLLAQDPTRTPDQIKYIIETTADDTVGSPTEDVPGWDQFFGYGRINAYRALSLYVENVKQTALKKEVDIYPNPTTGRVIIDLKQNIPVNYSIINIAGKIVSNGIISGPTSQIDLSSYAKGVYNIRLDNKDVHFVQAEVVK